MVKYRFEMVMEYPDGIHPGDVLDIARESLMKRIQNMSLDNLERLSSTIDIKEIMYRVKTTLERYGFEGTEFYYNINENRYYTHFLRGKEHLSIETTLKEDEDFIEAPAEGLKKEEPDVLEALTDGQLDEGDI